VFSTGTLIDSLRFRVHLADRLRVRPRDVHALVVGEHGTSEVFRFDALGTQWEIATGEPLDDALRQLIRKRIDDFEQTYSRFRDDSLVAHISAAPEGGRFLFPEDSTVLFDLYDRLYEATGGAVDPLVGRRLELLGYDRTYSLTPVPTAVCEAEALARPTWSSDVIRDGTVLITDAPLVIDVGAAGKGYLVDLVSEMLQTAGVTDYLIDGSGDLRHSGQPPVRIGLEHPFDPALVTGVSNLRDAALCASAVNRRAWADGLHHVLDARTGNPVDDVVATWVVAEDAATADGLATALFITAPEKLAETFSFAYLRMFADGRAEVSDNFDGDVFFEERFGKQGARDDRGTTTSRRRAVPASDKARAAVAAVAAAAVMAGCATAATDTTRSPYRDGVYTATGRYGSLPSSITVRVTLNNGVIRAVKVTPRATDPTSLSLQRRFAAAVPAVVVGKPIAKVQVGRLAGSSGTPDGFNRAIEQIKKQARRTR
jgi:FAD:protein FMN transferase